MRRTVALICGISLIGVACATRTSVRQHPEFNARSGRIKNMILLYPQVEINRKVAGGNVEKLKEEARRVANNLMDVVSKEFSSRGYGVRPGLITESGDQRIAGPIQNAFQELSEAMWNRIPDLQGEANSFKYTLSQDVSGLAESTSTDTIVFVKFNGVTRSGGDIASEVASKTLVAVATAGLIIPLKNPSGVALFSVALVDGRSGEVLWGNRVGKFFNGLSGPEFSTEDLAELFSKMIAPLPHRGSTEAQ